MAQFNNSNHQNFEYIYDEQTGITLYQYVNGNTLTEYADGSRIFFDAASGGRTGYNAQTGETTNYDLNGQAINFFDTSPTVTQIIDNTVTQVSDHATVLSTYDPVTGNTFVQNYDGFDNTAIFNTSGKLISSVNGDIPTAMKAAGLGIPDQPVQELRTYQEGNLESGQVLHGYEMRVGWESNHSSRHVDRNEVASGVDLNSVSTHRSQSFVGASSTGEIGAELNADRAHVHAHQRDMVGAEANVDAGYKGMMEVEGVDYKPGAEAQGHASAFAGAEAQRRVDLNVSSDSARGSLGGEAFAGAKAEVSGSGGVSMDGNEYARVEGGADVRAGVGVEGKIDAGYQDGQFQYGVDAGVAIGVGAGFKYEGEIDAPGIVTHPDAILESAIPEGVSDPLYQASNFAENPSGYVVEQIQFHIPFPQEVSQVTEVVSDPVGTVQDFLGL